MSTFQDGVVLLAHPRPTAEILAAIPPLLAARRASFDPDSCVIFHDLDDNTERDPTPAASEEAALQALGAWPAAGGLSYHLSGERLVLFLFGVAPRQVDYLTLSVRARAYDARPDIRDAFHALLAALHTRLGAVSTIHGFELLSPGSWIADEVAQVRAGSSSFSCGTVI